MICNDSNLTTDASLTVTYSISRECWDNPSNVMSYDSRKLHAKIVQCGLMPILFCIGAPANVLSMTIFYRQGLRDRMNLCLFCLAFVDLVYVTAVFIMVSYCFIGLFLPDQEQLWRMTFMKHTLYFVNGFGYSSGWLTMIIATERSVCVMFPMKTATIINTKTMAGILATSVLIIQSLCGVYVIKETLVYIRDDMTGRYVLILTNTSLFINNSIFAILENIVLSLISFVSFGVVVLTTALTVMRLHHAMAWRQSAASGSAYLKGQAVLVRMLVAVSCVYILCAAPNVALALARFTVPEFRIDGPNCNIFAATHLIGFLIVMFNSSINFFVYVTMSSRFRHELKECFHCGKGSLKPFADSASKLSIG